MTDPKAITCCFTGHRVIPKKDEAKIRAQLVKTISYLYGQGYRRFVAGGAIGFDAMAASAVLGFRKHYPDMKLILVLPCADQSAGWSDAEKRLYEEHKEEADEVICLSEHYYGGCMQKRNQAMVDASSACIAYLTRLRSGAGQTVRMAEKAGLRLFNTAPKE